MSEAEIDILVQATDEASGTIAKAAENIDGSLGSIDESQRSVSESSKSTSSSFKENALAMNNLGTASLGLYEAFDRIEGSQINVDKANLAVERSTRSLTLAQQAAEKAGRDLEQAQVAAEQTVENYGEGSTQAEAAQRKLTDAEQKYNDACQKLPIAQDAVTLAQQRQKMAADDANKSYLVAGLTVVPSLISITSSLNTVLSASPSIMGAVSSATQGISGAMSFLAANPIILVIAGIAALAVGLYAAYQNCKPFHEAIDAIGSVLGGALKAAITTIYDALSWLWKNVFVPLGEFIGNVFINCYLRPLQEAWNALSSGLQWLWHNVLEPVANFLQTVFVNAINVVMAPINALIGAVKTVSNVVGSIGGAIGGALKAIGLASGGIVTEPTLAVIGEAGPEAVIPLNKTFGDTLQDLSGSSSSVAPLSRASIAPMSTGGSAPVININAPLVNAQGSIDMQTANYILAQTRQMLQNVVVSPTSANGKTSRIRTIQPNNAVSINTY